MAEDLAPHITPEADHDSDSSDSEIGLEMSCCFEEIEEHCEEADSAEPPEMNPVLGVEPYQFEPVREEPVNAPEVVAEIHEADERERRLEGIDNWCTCGHCIVMDTARECICCREVQQVDRRRGHNDGCVTLMPGFQSVCLDPDVLETAYYGFCQDYGRDIDQELVHEQYRYIAYRQLVRWCWGFLGRHVRVILPSCAVSRIRAEFPAGGPYTGFRYPDEN